MNEKPNLPLLTSDQHEANPYATYDILREHYPVHYDESVDLWLVTRMADLRNLFRREDVNSKNYEQQIGRFHGRTLIEMEGKEHREHRRLLRPFLQGNGLENFVPRIREAAAGVMTPIVRSASETVSKDLVDSIVEENRSGSGDGGLYEFDLVEDFTAVYPITVTRAMLDVPDDMHDTVVRWYESIADGVADMTGSEEVFAAAMKTRDELREYFTPIIQERRHGDGVDLISTVAQAEVSGNPLTDEEICAFLSLIIDAGGETTDSALASLFKLLIEHPDQHREVFEDRSLVLDAIAEQLRHAPPVHIVLRTAVEDVEIEGTKIPKDAKIGMVLAAGNRDPEVFADPHRFDIHREDNDTGRAFRASADHISFADGRHFCVGNGLVREEVQIAVNALFDAMAAPPTIAEGHEAKEIGYYYRAPHELRIAFHPNPEIRTATIA